MELIRIILSGFMALLLTMPMCVCGSIISSEKAESEHSCCSHEDVEPEECGDDCDCSYHKKLEFLSEEAEGNLLPEYFKGVNNDFLYSYHLLQVTLAQELNQLAAPLYIVEPSKRVTLCIYRL